MSPATTTYADIAAPFRVNVTLMRIERLNVTFKRNGIPAHSAST